MDTATLNLLKGLSDGDLKQFQNAISTELNSRIPPNDYEPHGDEPHGDEATLPEALEKELTALYEDTTEVIALEITHPITLGVDINCSYYSGIPEQDMEMSVYGMEEPDAEELLTQKRVKEAYNSIWAKTEKFLARVKEVARQQNMQVEDVIEIITCGW